MGKEHQQGMASLSNEESLQWARICWYYFQEGQTQEAIANQLGLTRMRVNKILNEARSNGFVQFSINSRFGYFPELEDSLAALFGLEEVIVIPSPAEGVDPRRVLGAAAGGYISDHLGVDQSIGITWGGTVNAAALAIRRHNRSGNTVISLCGGMASSGHINPYDNAAMFARALNARCYYIPAPMYADDLELATALMRSASVRRVLEQVPHIHMAMLTAIDLTPQSKALEYGVIDEKQRASLLAAGSAGSICGHYLDMEGRLVEHPLNKLAIAPSTADIKMIPRLVLAAGGAQKVDVTVAGLRSGLAHVLITDEFAARELIRIAS